MMAAQLAAAPAGSTGTPPAGYPAGAPSNSTGAQGEKEKPMLPALRNRSGDSISPYVRAHAETPVYWQLLDNEAVMRAKQENKLIFISIGFLSCHYCRLTRQDSFSNPTIADLLNKHFIPIIVDREERPEIDAIYWNYIQTVIGDAGWPINVFLTPELEPVFGGTSWPSPGVETRATGADEEAPTFRSVIEKVQASWAERETQCRTEAQDTLLKLRKFAAEGTLAPRGLQKPGETSERTVGEPVARGNAAGSDLDLDLDQLEEAYAQLATTFDPVNGGFGFGFAPKFITPAKFTFLLRLARFPAAVRHIVGDEEVANATHMALHTLRKLRDGGLHDHLGAGFSRLSITEDWSLPLFEKMTADNALLLNLYLDAWLGAAGDSKPTRDTEFVDVVFELAEYLSSHPIRQKSGGFATGVASDSFYRKGDKHMRKGAYYVWKRREFETVLGSSGAIESQHEVPIAAAYWNVRDHGNVDETHDPNDDFINQNVLYVTKDAAEVGRQFGVPAEDVRAIVQSARSKLQAHREKERVMPEVDEMVVTCYNGMATAALARTGAALKRSGAATERGTKYIDVARKAAGFIRDHMWDSDSGILYRVYNGARGATQGFAEDYSFFIEGLLELYEACGEEEWLKLADDLQKRQIDLFYDRPDTNVTAPTTISSLPAQKSASGAFYSTTSPSPQAILRLKDGMDTAQPSANGVAVSNLFRLSAILCDEPYAHHARETLHAFEAETLQHPWLFPTLLSGVVTARLGGKSFLVTSRLEAATAAAATGTGTGTGDGAGDGGAAAGGCPGAEDDPTVTRFFTRPRAGSRSLIQVSTAGDTWLKTRNPALGRFLNADGQVQAAGGGGGYFLDEGIWRRATEADMREEEDDEEE